MSAPQLHSVMQWLIARARHVENEATARGRPPGVGLDAGIAFMHAPDDRHLLNLMEERASSADPEARHYDLKLRADLTRLRQGWRPDAHDLESAPHIRVGGASWTPFADPFTVSIFGAFLDADGSPTGRQRITSFLIAVDAREGKWARTWNRFYQLDDVSAENALRGGPHGEDLAKGNET